MKSKSPALLVFALFSLLPLSAQDVQWMSRLFASNVTSEGTAFNGEWTFHLGYFKEGFEATAENTADWTTNWKAVDSCIYDPAQARFVSVWQNDGSVKASTQLFIWGVSGQQTGGEWIMMSSSKWKLTQQAAGPQSLPLQLLAGQADEVVLGTVAKAAAKAGAPLMTSVPVEGNPPVVSNTLAAQ